MIYFLVALWLILSVAVAGFAESKGLDRLGYFLLALLLSPLVGAILAALAKPDPGGLVKAGAARQCPHCAELVKPEAKVCRFCGRDLPPPAEEGAPHFATREQYESWKKGRA